jgi:hypothetical protein
MTTKRGRAPAHEAALTRVLEALEPELVMATDEEIHEAARGLGMDLGMKGSAAFIGLTTPSTRLFMSEFFGWVDQVKERLAEQSAEELQLKSIREGRWELGQARLRAIQEERRAGLAARRYRAKRSHTKKDDEKK